MKAATISPAVALIHATLKRRLKDANAAFLKSPGSTQWRAATAAMLAYQQSEQMLRHTYLHERLVSCTVGANLPEEEWGNAVVRVECGKDIEEVLQEFA
jgi:hypothetical protein